MFTTTTILLSIILVQAVLLLLLLRAAYTFSKWKEQQEHYVQEVARRLSEMERYDDRLDIHHLHLNQEEINFFKQLSIAETKVILSLVENRSNKEIAQELGYSVGYVYNMKAGIKKKYAQMFEGANLDQWIKFRVTE